MKLLVSPAEARRAERDAHVTPKRKANNQMNELIKQLEAKAEYWRKSQEAHSTAVYVALNEIIDAIKQTHDHPTPKEG